MSEEAAAQKDNLEFSRWCVMVHARPAVIKALRAWGMEQPALAFERANSLNGLKVVAAQADATVRGQITFSPLRRDLSNAINILNAAATFALRGDAENTAAVVIGAFTGAASALAWRRPWLRLRWKRQRHQVIIDAQQQQQDYREQLRNEIS